MLNPELKLNEGWHETPPSATRDGFGAGLVEAGANDANVMAVCADLTESTRMAGFKERFPERFVQLGVSEQLLAAMSAGLALAGKIPFVASFAMFCPGRAWEQVRTNICLNGANVKIAGAHAGISVGEDGATHQAIEDIAIMRCLPNMTVLVPCDTEQTRRATLAATENVGPIYLRFGRMKTPVLTTALTPFEIGRAQVMRDGNDVAIIACGLMVSRALEAAETLSARGVNCLVLNNHTVKPMDDAAVLAAAGKCGAVVTAEEHQVAGGMGSAVAELLAREMPVPIEFVGVQDRFGQSGEAEELFKEYGLTAEEIMAAALRAVGRK